MAEQVAGALHRAWAEVWSSTPNPGANPRSPWSACAPCAGTRWSYRPLRPPGRSGPMSWSPCARSDEDNLVISLLAEKGFNVPRVIARVNDPANDELFTRSWGSLRWSDRRQRWSR